jgi:hypothetical protein
MTLYICSDWTKYCKYLKRKGLISSNGTWTKCAPGRGGVCCAWRPGQAKLSLSRLFPFQAPQYKHNCGARRYCVGPDIRMLRAYNPSLSGSGEHSEALRD